MSAFSSAMNGVTLSASLVMAIGAQNAFVLRQGIARQHVLLTALCCTLCDFMMMGAGILGMGVVLRTLPQLERWMAIAGAMFVFSYGCHALWRVAHPRVIAACETQGLSRPGAVILAALGFSILNPHAILDTIVLIGSIGAQYPTAERGYFLLGAVGVSCLWFFSLSFLASRLSPLFRTSLAWRVLDGFIAIMMFLIAASLLCFIVHPTGNMHLNLSCFL